MIIYADRPETVLRSSAKHSASARNHVLLGTWLEILETAGSWHHVRPRPNRGKDGWVHKEDVAPIPALKIFFVDVGQGDGAIVEGVDGRVLVDGGPNKGFHSFLRHRYRPLIQAGEKVHFDAVVMSHPDSDHYRGLTRVLEDDDFTFGTVYHNGIIRYRDDSVAGDDFDLGQLTGPVSERVLTETFDDLDEAGALVDGGQLMSTFEDFWLAAWNAREGGRLEGAKRLTSRDAHVPGYALGDPAKLGIRVLGPVPTATTGPVHFKAFRSPESGPTAKPSSSHTRNGHSVVLRFEYGKHSFLLGGDLNIPAERHLLEHFGDENPFRVDLAKGCHHGSSDFLLDYLKRVRPRVNVVSSGDNKSFDHPTADAIGTAARWSRGSYPLFFSTELGRANSSKGVHYGLVNVRSNGKTLVTAQMKEQHKKKADVWDSFTVPWKGKFA